MSNIFAKLDRYGIVELKVTDNIVYLPEGIESLQGMDFDGFCTMEGLYIPKTIKSVHWNGVGRCDFKRFIVNPENETFVAYDGILYTKVGLNRDSKTKRKKWSELVACPTNVEKVVIKNGTKGISNCAFKGSNVIEVILPDGLEEIGTNAFYMTPNLRSFEIPAFVKLIGSIGNTKLKHL